jgi:GT2 family glycosyltransferase
MEIASLMIVTYNRLDLTKETVKSIFENTKFPFRLCIVDNGSTDGTVEWLNELQPEGACVGFSFKLNEENRGIAIGRNQALVLANKFGDSWLATLDNDVLLPDGWLSQSISVLKNNPQYGAIGVNMENVKYPMVALGGCEFQNKPQGNLGTACMVFNRALHNLLGFFNSADYKLYAHEDADFGMRIRVVGLKLGYIGEMGKHVGEGENDVGEYREFKNEWGKRNLPAFHKNARAYFSKTKSYYINFEDDE